MYFTLYGVAYLIGSLVARLENFWYEGLQNRPFFFETKGYHFPPIRSNCTHNIVKTQWYVFGVNISFSDLRSDQPKKKTGQRKKAEKQKERQKQIIRAPKTDIGKAPGNAEMICDQCNKRQKNRAFCYFCQSLQRLPMCAHCGNIWFPKFICIIIFIIEIIITSICHLIGRTKCMQAGGDCLVKHMGTFATGITLVVRTNQIPIGI